MDKTENSNVDKRIYTMREESPGKAVIKMGLPLVAGLLFMGMYNLVDTFFIGMLDDDYKIAAVSLAYPIMMISVAVSNMIGTGGASLIARSLGSNERWKAQKTLVISFELTFIFSIVVAASGLIFIDKIVDILGAKENTVLFTKEYVGIIFLGSIFIMGNYIMGQLLRSEGSSKYSMVGMIAGTIANIILDPIFIILLGMGVKGAAIATVLGNAIGTVISLYFYFSGKSLLKLDIKLCKPSVDILKEIFWVGTPAMLETMLTSVAYIINNNFVVGYGELTVTAMGISQKIITIGSNVYQGFAAGNQPLIGYNYGAKNYGRMLSLLKAGVIAVSVTEAIVIAIYGIFAPVLIGIFSKTPEVISIGSMILRANMFALLFVGTVSMVRISFQAMGKPMYAFVITVLRQFVIYVPLLLILNSAIGLKGMIWAQPITESVMMGVSLVLIISKIRQLQRKSYDLTI